VRMTRKIIYQPVIHTVWNIETCQFLKKSKVADRIKRFTEIRRRTKNRILALAEENTKFGCFIIVIIVF